MAGGNNSGDMHGGKGIESKGSGGNDSGDMNGDKGNESTGSGDTTASAGGGTGSVACCGWNAGYPSGRGGSMPRSVRSAWSANAWVWPSRDTTSPANVECPTTIHGSRQIATATRVVGVVGAGACQARSAALSAMADVLLRPAAALLPPPPDVEFDERKGVGDCDGEAELDAVPEAEPVALEVGVAVRVALCERVAAEPKSAVSRPTRAPVTRAPTTRRSGAMRMLARYAGISWVRSSSARRTSTARERLWRSAGRLAGAGRQLRAWSFTPQEI
jgi:hypothetical protein